MRVVSKWFIIKNSWKTKLTRSIWERNNINKLVE